MKIALFLLAVSFYSLNSHAGNKCDLDSGINDFGPKVIQLLNKKGYTTNSATPGATLDITQQFGIFAEGKCGLVRARLFNRTFKDGDNLEDATDSIIYRKQVTRCGLFATQKWAENPKRLQAILKDLPQCHPN